MKCFHSHKVADGYGNDDRGLAEVSAKRVEAQSRAGLLEWIRATQPNYARILDEVREIEEQLENTRTMLNERREIEAKITSAMRSEENLAKQVSAQLTAKREELARLRVLSDATLVWEKNRDRLTAISDIERNLVNTLESSRADESKLSAQSAAMAEEENLLSHQIAEVDRNQSEVKQLLSQLQRYVQDSNCPLCGQDHGSKEVLLRRIHEHVAADAASNNRLDLDHIRQRTRELAREALDAKRRRQTIEVQLNRLKQEQSQLASETKAFAESLEKLGVVIGDSSSMLRSQLLSIANEVESVVTSLTNKAKELQESLSRMRGVHAKANEDVQAGTADLTVREQTLNRLQGEIQRLRQDPRLAQISLDVELAQLADMDRDCQRDISDLNDALAKAEADATSHRAHLSSLRQESGALKNQLSNLRAQLTNLQKKLTEITARLTELKLPRDATEKILLSLIGKESQSQTHLLALRDSANNIELAVDAATTAAALTRLRGNIRNIEKALIRAKKKGNQHQPWLKYFDQLSHLVSSQQDDAFTNFTRDYGPRTSVIQRRLRSVYGFDEIEIQSQRSTISVRVRRHGEELRPTDYFSQSQQQTLLLGLFLTACISQTWSGLSPVFLDDPVTHFDDLNTYAFLDLIVGLLESDIGRRQFIISTCDEKFLQLSRQKFRYLGKGAKFYHFSAISAEGPVVTESPSQS